MGILSNIALCKKRLYGKLTEESLETKFGIIDEMTFLDPATVEVIVREYQKRHIELSTMAVSELTLENRQEILDLEEIMAFYASNSIGAIDWCSALMKNNDSEFSVCIEALSEYRDGNHERAFELFSSHFNKNTQQLNHFLVNRVFGELLCMNGQEVKGAIYLRLALKKRPEDTSLARKLSEVYSNIGEYSQVENLRSIVAILEGK